MHSFLFFAWLSLHYNAPLLTIEACHAGHGRTGWRSRQLRAAGAPQHTAQSRPHQQPTAGLSRHCKDPRAFPLPSADSPVFLSLY